MKKCKECQLEIDSKAKRCPHCRADQRGFLSKHPLITGIGIIFLIAWLSISLGTTSPRSTTSVASTPEDKSDLAGNVNFSSGVFTIKNDEDKDWERCYFTVNSKYRYPSNAPSTVLEPIKAGESIEVSYSNFTLSDGSRFNPYQTKAKDFAISCGSRFGYWQWD